MRLIILFPLLLIFSACSQFESVPVPLTTLENNTTSHPQPEEPVSEEPETHEKLIFIEMDWDSHSENAYQWSVWTYEALEELGGDLLAQRPSDVLEFCATYDELDLEEKKMFWIRLISVMTRYESFFDPSVQYQEAFDDQNGDPIVSRGLLQLSIESGRGYGCELENEQALHDPKTNLRCGVRILNRWIGRDGVISLKDGTTWKGGARYWAVLRTYESKDHVANVKARTQLAEVCQP